MSTYKTAQNALISYIEEAIKQGKQVDKDLLKLVAKFEQEADNYIGHLQKQVQQREEKQVFELSLAPSEPGNTQHHYYTQNNYYEADYSQPGKLISVLGKVINTAEIVLFDPEEKRLLMKGLKPFALSEAQVNSLKYQLRIHLNLKVA